MKINKTNHPGQHMHKLLNAVEAVRAGNYQLVPGKGSRTRSMSIQVKYAAKVTGFYVGTPFEMQAYDKEASDGCMHRQMPDWLYDKLQGRFYGIKNAFARGKSMWDKSEWLQCGATSFCKVVMDGSLSEDFDQLVNTFGARVTADHRHLSYMRDVKEMHSITLPTVNFTPSDAVLFKLAHCSWLATRQRAFQ
ncbi:hypothetical protein [Belnapia sp. F-4-1]|uniref:hypothetical protein n=1 Tax=Belnapia sp. F-4-1 TaxID=1545443 RepID=UPI00118681CC|nr:hypothetical protein [Belnapia sp. F-4-1]